MEFRLVAHVWSDRWTSLYMRAKISTHLCRKLTNAATRVITLESLWTANGTHAFSADDDPTIQQFLQQDGTAVDYTTSPPTVTLFVRASTPGVRLLDYAKILPEAPAHKFLPNTVRLNAYGEPYVVVEDPNVPRQRNSHFVWVCKATYDDLYGLQRQVRDKAFLAETNRTPLVQSTDTDYDSS